MTYQARIYITLRPDINDPQGLTIRDGLHTLGYGEVGAVRAGKYLELTVEAGSEAEAGERVTQMCRRLLANPVIEDFRFDLQA